MKKNISFLLLFCFFCQVLLAQEKEPNYNLIKLDKKNIAAAKLKIKAGNKAVLPVYKQLLKEADESLKFKPVTVMEKKVFPPSGNKHDYMSIAPYWYPDPTKPDGLPYIRKDGQTTPEVKNYPDKQNLPRLSENIYQLSLAYYFSGEEKYAQHAAKLLKVWFLDTATKMNPNLNFGQAVKGINTGRGAGLIDARHFIFMMDGASLLEGSKHFSKANESELKKWFSDFLTWMQTSKIGKEEMEADNNHGVWYDALRLSIVNYTGDRKSAKDIVKMAAARLNVQLDTTGSFPAEMERTISLHYTVFIMQAYFIIAQLSQDTDTNLWTARTASGKSLSKAFDFLMPYITQQKTWTGQQIKPFQFQNAYPILLQGSQKFNCKECLETVRQNKHSKTDLLLMNLL
ncbi:MAG: alginate lyase family protein [Bacteroidota bacterium]